jgi:hypothetical protein
MPRLQGCQSGTLANGSSIPTKQFPSEHSSAHIHALLADSRFSTRYFQEVLFALSSPPFYTKYVYLPSDTTPIPDEIQNNPKFYPFFKGALGAMVHISIVAPLLPNGSQHGTEKEVSRKTVWHAVPSI